MILQRIPLRHKAVQAQAGELGAGRARTGAGTLILPVLLGVRGEKADSRITFTWIDCAIYFHPNEAVPSSAEAVDPEN